MRVNFNTSDFRRPVAKEASLRLRNRYFEQNPSLSDDGAALIARPGLKFWIDVGEGPIRGIFSEPSLFGGDLFVASGADVYRVNSAGVATRIAQDLYNVQGSTVTFAGVQAIGAVPDRMFFCDGKNLLVYETGTSSEPIDTPDDIGIFDITMIASYVICIPVQTDEFIGRFYWILPGEKVIDDLDYATAESYPDAITGVERFGDQFWLCGERATEVWYASGDPSIPMQRLQGVVFNRGAWESTAVAIKDTLVMVDADGDVWAVQGNSPQKISTPDIAEAIRKAIARNQNFS